MLTLPIFDDAGRLVQEPREVPEPRAIGPWDSNRDERDIVRVCCGCPDKAEREAQATAAGKVCSHYFCDACVAEWDRQADVYFGKAQ